jgi:hypothetical protein
MRFLVCFASSVLAVSLFAAPMGREEKAVLKVLQVKYAGYLQAFRAKDQTFQDRMLTPDYTANQPGQPVMDRNLTIKTFNALMLQAQDVKWTRSFSQVTLKGNEATVLFDGHFSAKMAMRDGKPHQIDFFANNEDTWVQVGKDWKLRHSQLIKSTMKVDGKAVASR